MLNSEDQLPMDLNLSWHQAATHCENLGECYVLVTVLGVSGSTPRDPGSKMVVTESKIFGSIGGGQLEWLVISDARQKLSEKISGFDQKKIFIDSFPLAAEAKQCCGGFVSVLLEVHLNDQWHIALFGAGHVAQRVISMLSELPCRVSWFEQRKEYFPEKLPVNVKSLSYQCSKEVMEELPIGSDVLILTHEHELDYQLTYQALCRENLATIGLIGSETKANRFRAKLAREGMSQDRIDTLFCPVGLTEFKGKLPMEIAISIVAFLLKEKEKQKTASHDQKKGLTWKEIKKSLVV